MLKRVFGVQHITRNGWSHFKQYVCLSVTSFNLLVLLRSNRISSSRIGVSTPDSYANRLTNASYPSSVFRGTMLRIAAFVSKIVTSIPNVFPRTNPLSPTASVPN